MQKTLSILGTGLEVKMSKVEHNEENIARLAEEVTDSVEMDTLIQHFYEDQYNYYENDKKAFETDWQDMIGDEDD
jgi:hypothetical protein